MAPRMVALVIRKVRFPMVMDHRPREWAKNARLRHRLVATLGMDFIRRQTLGAGDMQPMQLPPHPQPRLIHMQHRGVAQQAFHRFRGRGNARVQVLRSLPHRRCAHPVLYQVFTYLRRPLHGNMVVVGEVRRPSLHRLGRKFASLFLFPYPSLAGGFLLLWLLLARRSSPSCTPAPCCASCWASAPTGVATAGNTAMTAASPCSKAVWSSSSVGIGKFMEWDHKLNDSELATILKPK